MHHELKIWPKYYARVKSGEKTFEVRKNDRDFQAEDTVTLREYDPDKQGVDAYSSYQMTFRIGYVLAIDAERVVFSLLPLSPP